MDLLSIVKQDKELKNVLSELSEEEIQNNLLTLYNQAVDDLKCSSCNGKKECQLATEYLRSKLVNNEGIVNRVYSECPFKKTKVNYLYMNVENNNSSLYERESRKEIYSKMKESLTSNKGIYLHGSFGCGKSFLMMKLAEAFANNNKEVYFVYYPELVNKVKNCMCKNDNSYENTIEALKNADVLFLDDIGREQNTQYNRDQILGVILQHRCMNNLKTYMTSNYDLDMLQEHLADTKEKVDTVNSLGIISRIKSLMEIISLEGRSIR